MKQSQDQLSLAAIRRIDEICDQFESSCRAEQPAGLSSLLRGWDGPERSALVSELVLIDLHYAGRRGVPRERGDYLACSPDDGPAIDQAFQQAAGVASVSTLDESGGNADRTAGPQEAVQDDAAAIPEHIGRYHVLRELGAGAFGVVYLAHDPELNRQVAIKCPKPGVWRRDSRWEMFRREAELAAKMRHPGVVAIHDIGRDESGRPFFVMEYVRGESLKDRLTRGRIDSRYAIQMAIALAEALDGIHQSGLVHRDLKPANVLLDEAGRPHIADLGLALNADCSITDELAGTFAYMAPEQVPAERPADEFQDLDHRCDIWAVGVILYEMLVGRRPFEGGSRTELFRQILHVTPPTPSSIGAHVHPSVAQICLTCLAKSPASRYASAGALADALQRVPRGSYATRSRRRLAVLAASVLAVLAAVPTIRQLRSADDSTTDPAAIAPAGAEIAAAPVPSQQPFVIRDSGERFADLYAAIDAAPDGAIIEIDADGPMAVEQVDVGQRGLTICAARGRRPVITLADESQRCMLRTAGTLVLEGLDLRRGTPGSRAAGNAPSLVHVEAPGSLHVKRCCLIITSTTRRRSHCIHAAGDCLVQDSELNHQNGGGVMWFPADGARLAFDNCVAGVVNLAVLHGDRSSAATVELRRSTVSAEHAFIAIGTLQSPSESRLLLRAENCYFDVEAVLHQVVPFAGRVPQTIESVRNTFFWEGKQNVFAVRDTFVRSTFGGQRTSLQVDDLAAWTELWGTVSGSIEISAAENRMAPESVDYSIPIRERLDWVARDDERPIGFIAGADLDSVGPEASYLLRE